MEDVNFLIPFNSSVPNSTVHSVDRNFAQYELVTLHLPPCQLELNTIEKKFGLMQKTEWPRMLQVVKKIGQIPVFINNNRRMDGQASRRNCEKLRRVWAFDGPYHQCLVIWCYYQLGMMKLNMEYFVMVTQSLMKYTEHYCQLLGWEVANKTQEVSIFEKQSLIFKLCCSNATIHS